MAPRLCNGAVDSDEVHSVGLFQAPLHIVDFNGPSLEWHGPSLSVLIGTLSSC